MQETIWLDANLTAMRDAVPIRFAHHKSVDSPEKHVLHINNYVEIYVYVSGDHQYIVEDALYQLHRGDVIIINPLEVHKALPAGNALYERFYFLVDCRTFDAMHQNPLQQILNKPGDMGNLISFDPETRELVLSLLYRISDCFQEGREEQIPAFGYFLQIIGQINRYLERGRTCSGGVAHTPALLEKILTYVAENTAQIQSITEIASYLGMTPQYLSGYFSHHIGTPLKTYIQAKKIALAKDLLDKGADVTTACYECGFNDCSYFIRIFKKYVGMTPFHYKQSAERQA